MPEPTTDAARNREHWDASADAYQERHRAFIGRGEPRWGMWQLPEDELRILGDVDGLDVLELGCGAAQWSILLAGRGARMTALDNSARQLEHAREALATAGLDFPLVHASAEAIPLPDESFDVVFCDHGALTFADPYRAVPEAARLLRPGGLLAFSHSTPFSMVFWRGDDLTESLQADYFSMHDWDEGDHVEYNLAHGEWVRLLVASGFMIEALLEIQPPENAESTYRTPPETAWARRWPMEEIWRARKT